jgi:hypothetical protein
MRRTGDTVIASENGWVLIHCTAASKAEWISLKVECPSKKEKRNWWFGWNGTRIAKNRDSGLLQQHHPEIVEWVERKMKDAHNV